MFWYVDYQDIGPIPDLVASPPDAAAKVNLFFRHLGADDCTRNLYLSGPILTWSAQVLSKCPKNRDFGIDARPVSTRMLGNMRAKGCQEKTRPTS